MSKTAHVTVELTVPEATALLRAAQPDDFPVPAGAAGAAHDRALTSAVDKLGGQVRLTDGVAPASL